MNESVELSTLDLRDEGHRLRDDAREARLLASIAERGIEEPLEGVDTPDCRFLLNGLSYCQMLCAGVADQAASCRIPSMNLSP
jgi:hypothetical protein